MSGVPAPCAGARFGVGRSALVLALAYLLLALPLGVVLAVQVPLGHHADEPQHLMRAEALLRGQWLGHRETVIQPDGTATAWVSVRADPAVLAVMVLPALPVAGRPARMTMALSAAAQAVPWGAAAPERVGVIGSYFPVFYAPAALAVGAVRLSGGGPADAFLAARLVNLLLATAAGAAALLLARRGAGLLFCVLAVPMTLSLSASASQEGLLIAATVLAVALHSRAEAGGGEVSRSGWYAASAMLLAGIVAVKPPYLPMLALLLLPLRWDAAALRAGLRRRALLALLASVPALLWAWGVHDLSGVGLQMPPYEAGPLWPGARPARFDGGDPAAQLLVLLARPEQLLLLPVRTLWHDRLPYVAQVLGMLDWLSRALPRWLYVAWLAALCGAVVADAGAPVPPARHAWRDSLLLLAAATACGLGTLLAAYLTWTPVGATIIEGFQGRYLLPLLALLARAVPLVPAARRLRPLLLLPPAVAALDVAVLPRLVLDWFYLS